MGRVLNVGNTTSPPGMPRPGKVNSAHPFMCVPPVQLLSGGPRGLGLGEGNQCVPGEPLNVHAEAYCDCWASALVVKNPLSTTRTARRAMDRNAFNIAIMGLG